MPAGTSELKDFSASHCTDSITSAYVPVVTVILSAPFGPLRVLIPWRVATVTKSAGHDQTYFNWNQVTNRCPKGSARYLLINMAIKITP